MDLRERLAERRKQRDGLRKHCRQLEEQLKRTREVLVQKVEAHNRLSAQIEELESILEEEG